VLCIYGSGYGSCEMYDVPLFLLGTAVPTAAFIAATMAVEKHSLLVRKGLTVKFEYLDAVPDAIQRLQNTC